MKYWNNVISGKDIPLPPTYRYLRVVATTGAPQCPINMKVEYFNEEGEGKSFDNCIDRAKNWLKRWKR